MPLDGSIDEWKFDLHTLGWFYSNTSLLSFTGTVSS